MPKYLSSIKSFFSMKRYFIQRQIHQLEKKLCKAFLECNHYDSLCQSYTDTRYRIQFKQWDIDNCQTQISKLEHKLTTCLEGDKQKILDELQTLENTTLPSFKREMKVYKDNVAASKEENNKNYENLLIKRRVVAELKAEINKLETTLYDR